MFISSDISSLRQPPLLNNKFSKFFNVNKIKEINMTNDSIMLTDGYMDYHYKTFYRIFDWL